MRKKRTRQTKGQKKGKIEKRKNLRKKKGYAESEHTLEEDEKGGKEMKKDKKKVVSIWDEYEKIAKEIGHYNAEDKCTNSIAVLSAVNAMFLYNISKNTYMRLDSIIAVFGDIVEKTEDVEMFKKKVEENWPDKPILLQAIEKAKEDGCEEAELFVAYYEAEKRKREEAEQVIEIFEKKGNPFRLAGLYGEDNQTFASLFSDETDKTDNRVARVMAKGALCAAQGNGPFANGVFTIREYMEDGTEVVYGLLTKHGRIFSIPKENVQKSLEVQSDGTAVPLLEKERTAYLPYFPSAELSESKVLRDSS